MDESQQQESRSSIKFERTAKGVIVPRVSIYSGDFDPRVLDAMLEQAKRVFEEALEFAMEKGATP